MITQFQPLAMNRATRVRNVGFSLVEVMVGMVIGLLTVIVIMQSYATFEGQKRTTNNNSDTQENGLVALHAIETDARMAGFGLITPNGLACTTMNISWNDPTGGATPFPAAVPIAPVSITDGGAGASDTLTFTYSTAPSGSNPSVLNTTMTDSDADVKVDATNTVGFNIDKDLILISTPVVSPGTGANIPCTRLAFTSSTASANTVYNPAVGHNLFPAGGYLASQSFVLNMGSFRQNMYAVSGVGATSPDLTVTDVSIPGQAALSLSSNIVNIQAQYGVAATNLSPGVSSPPVICWTDATGTGCNASSNWANPNAADIMRIKAVRIAIVARSSLQEKPASGVGAAATCNATTNAPISWTSNVGAGSTPPPTINLNLPGDPNANPNWQCHRYRVYQTIIPLRNMIWANI